MIIFLGKRISPNPILYLSPGVAYATHDERVEGAFDQGCAPPARGREVPEADGVLAWRGEDFAGMKIRLGLVISFNPFTALNLDF